MSYPFSLSRQLSRGWRNFRPKAGSLARALRRSHARDRATTALTVWLAALAAANILLSSLTYGYVLFVVGPGPQTDALFASIAVPRLILAVIGGSLTQVLLPVLAVQTAEDAGRSGWNLFLLLGSGLIALEILLHVLAPFWVAAVVPGFSEESRSFTVVLSRIHLAGMVVSVLCGVLATVHQANKRFVRVELISLFAAGSSFLFLLWALEGHGVKAAAWAVLLRTGVQLLLLLPGAVRFCVPDWRNPVVVEIWCRFKPLLFGTAYYKLGPMIDRFLSSMSPAGGLSLFYFGQQAVSMVNDIIYKAFTIPTIPLLSRHAQAQDWPGFRSLLRRRLLIVGTVTGAGYLTFLVLGEWILSGIASHARLSDADVRIFWWIIVALVGFLIAGALGQITSAAFYAKGNTATPTKVGVFGFTLGILFKIVGFFQFGLVGIAAATTLYYILNFVVLLILQKRELVHAGAS